MPILTRYTHSNCSAKTGEIAQLLRPYILSIVVGGYVTQARPQLYQKSVLCVRQVCIPIALNSAGFDLVIRYHPHSQGIPPLK